MKTRLLIILTTFVLLFPLQLIYAPPLPNHKQAFDYAEHVLIGKILSVEILSEPHVQITANTGSTIAGIALYEVQVEKYLKNPLDTNIIKVPGYYVNDEHVRSGFDLLYDVDEKVFLYIQTDPHNALDGYDLIIRNYESRSLDRMGPICDASDTFYHKGECKEIPDCPFGTELKNGVCNVIDMNVPPFNSQDCLIATASYGSELAPQVQMLREIRDNTLLNTESGKIFMSGFNSVYYSFSPQIAQLENKNPIFKEIVKTFITPMIYALSIMTLAEEGSEFQVITLGISTIGLVSGMYVVAPVVLVWKVGKKKIKFNHK